MPPYVTSGAIGTQLDQTHAERKFAVGTELNGTGGSLWRYVCAVSAIAQYNAACIDNAGNAKNLTKTLVDAGQVIAVPQVAFAAGEYGWMARRGADPGLGLRVRVLANCAANASLYTSATAGALDDTSTSQTEIIGITLVSAAVTAGNKPFLGTVAFHARGI